MSDPTGEIGFKIAGYEPGVLVPPDWKEPTEPARPEPPVVPEEPPPE